MIEYIKIFSLISRILISAVIAFMPINSFAASIANRDLPPEIDAGVYDEVVSMVKSVISSVMGWVDGIRVARQFYDRNPSVITGSRRKEAEQKALEMLAAVQIPNPEAVIKQYPHQLSGGMKQRAAFLRTYLASDSVALLDEPFSALDTITKSAVHQWYLDIMEKIRLQKFLSENGVASRRKSEELIEFGKVKVNGRVATIGDKIDPVRDKVTVKGKTVVAVKEKVYIISVIEHVDKLISEGFDKKNAIAEVAKIRKIPKRNVYNEYENR